MGNRVDAICYRHTCAACGHRFPITGFCPIILGYALLDGTCDKWRRLTT